MRILLTNPFSPKPIESPLVLATPMMPLGLGFIAAVLEKKGHEVLMLDNYLRGSGWISKYSQTKRFKKALKDYNPDFVGISTHSAGFQKTLELVSLIKESSRARIICGGPHASEVPENFPNTVDFVVQGEGEFVTLDIIEGRVTERIAKAERINDLDKLPMVAWHLFELKKYKLREPMYLPHPPIFNLNTSRGCPFSCRFCSVHKCNS